MKGAGSVQQRAGTWCCEVRAADTIALVARNMRVIRLNYQPAQWVCCGESVMKSKRGSKSTPRRARRC
jgi:hypothetical protein